MKQGPNSQVFLTKRRISSLVDIKGEARRTPPERSVPVDGSSGRIPFSLVDTSKPEPLNFQECKSSSLLHSVAGLVYIHMNFLFMLLPGVPVLSFLVRSALE